jgi:hypothetical protein
VHEPIRCCWRRTPSTSPAAAGGVPAGHASALEGPSVSADRSRPPARAAAYTARAATSLVRVQFAKVAEYQRRGIIHFHALIRLDGVATDDDAYPPPAVPVDSVILADLVRTAAGQVAQITLTMNTYAHVLPQVEREALDQAARALFGENSGGA